MQRHSLCAGLLALAVMAVSSANAGIRVSSSNHRSRTQAESGRLHSFNIRSNSRCVRSCETRRIAASHRALLYPQCREANTSADASCGPAIPSRNFFPRLLKISAIVGRLR